MTQQVLSTFLNTPSGGEGETQTTKTLTIFYELTPLIEKNVPVQVEKIAIFPQLTSFKKSTWTLFLLT